MSADVTALRIHLPNRPGALEEVARALAREGVAPLGLSLTSEEARKRADLVVRDVETVEEALDDVAIGRRSREALLVPLPRGSKGLDHMARRLAQAGVDAETSLLLPRERGRDRLAVVVDDRERAREALAGTRPPRP